METTKKEVSEFVWPGRITQVIDPHYFWMQLGTRENLLQFEQLQRDMQVFACQNWAPASSIDELEPGMVVLVDSDSEDLTCLKRGQIARVMHGNSVDVFYVDYGNTELKTVDKICINVPTKFKVCPPQAVRCSLAGVKPLVKSWTSRGIKTFQQLTGDELLHVLVLYGEPGYCEVALYQSDVDNGRSVGHSLVAEEVAMIMEEQMVPEFLQDIPTFMTQGYQDTSQATNTSTPRDDHKTEAKVSSTPPSTEKYIPPHQKNLGSSPGSAGSSLTNHNTASQSSFSRQNSNSGSRSSVNTSRSPASKTKEPVNDFFPFDNVSVYPPSPNSPVKSPGKALGYGGNSPRSRPKLNIPQSEVSQPPFYPPEQIGDSVGEYAEPKIWNLTPPQAFEQTHLPYGLNPPAFYQTHIPPPPINQSVQYYTHSAPPVSPIKQPGNSGIVLSSPVKVPHQNAFDSGVLQSSPGKVPHHNDFDGRLNQQSISSHYHDTYYKLEYRQGQEAVHSARSALNNGHSYFNQNNSSHGRGRNPVKLQMPSTPSKYYGYEPPKMSPESPESPAIAAFNLGDLEHTQMTSTDHFHQQLYQETLQALHEEAEDIARESKEQSELVHFSRYARAKDQFVETEDYMPASDNLDVYDQIAQEIQNTSLHSCKGPEELKKSPIKKTGKVKEPGNVSKLEGIPQSYIADINFTEAVKEALESGKTSGMDNARALLDGIVESLKLANVEKQLYDVLLLMLAKAVKEYNLYHTVVMETINTLNGELEIKECLGKALKRQQELCVRVPTPRQPQHLDFSRVMAHIYNMALDWNESNASIQDGILQTVEKWIVFNNKGSQIGQVDKENVFLDCFGAFWEVSGTQLIQHNEAFRLRIKDEVRKKLLNENVSRSVRERLLDIMLDLFSLNTEKRSVSTQTQRRTMIPSSCQVRPSACDKATFMESEWQDEGFRNMDLDVLSQMNWQVNTDYASPDPELSLRPLGRGGPVQTLSTPKDSFCSTESNDTLDTSNVSDLSKFSTKTDSVYVTPSESCVADTDRDRPQLNVQINGINEVSPTPKKSSDSRRQNLMSSLEADFEQSSNESFSAALRTKDFEVGKDIQNQNVNMNNDKCKTIAEQKSAIGKSLVDWFDYEPPAVENARNGAKLEEKRLETRKKLDSTSMEIIENDVALKYAPTKDLGKKKSKKDKDRERKGEKVNTSVDDRKQESNRSIEPSAFESDVQQAIIESLQNYGNKGTVKTARDIDNSTENRVDENIDWWAVGEAADTRYFDSGAEESIGDNIYIDNGPDVIIEDEFEQDVNNIENVNIKVDNGMNSEPSGAIYNEKHQNIVGEKFDKMDKCLSDSSEDEIGRNNIMVQERCDNFAFDLDDDDDDENWDSASSDDLNVNDWVGLQHDNPGYEKDFPETDLKTVLPQTKDVFTEPTEKASSDKNYEYNFPKSNLADFVKVKEESEVEERPRATRWVPGRRKCMNCYSEDHTTESCQQFVILQ
ncbi:uncharacterized protein LOC123547663 [Mercenaria mercenaria]|uniref:uncharacterized protein LOC123547663 n=1 Tax=Mercenaria mercenaria TaxID=6596 RepID=UPI00234F906A|nr:uncharacterized protein LOC123547663 [Mercenaria mercenaria]